MSAFVAGLCLAAGVWAWCDRSFKWATALFLMAALNIGALLVY